MRGVAWGGLRGVLFFKEVVRVGEGRSGSHGNTLQLQNRHAIKDNYHTVEFESACIIMVTLWDLVPATKYLHGKAKNSNQALLIRGVTRIFEPRRQ